MTPSRLASCALLLMLAACGLGVSGLGPSDLDGQPLADAGSAVLEAGPVPDEAASSGDGSAPAVTCGMQASCYPAVPPGWTGPLELFDSPSATEPACAGAFASTPTFEGHDDLSAVAAQCSTCSCDAPSGATCPDPSIQFFTDGTCGSPCASVTASAGACTAFDPSNCRDGDLHASASVPQPEGGACVPSAETAIVPAVTWGRAVRACRTAQGPAQGSCGTGEVCAPDPGLGFAPHPCISQGGDTACPSGAYSVKRLGYDGAVDDAEPARLARVRRQRTRPAPRKRSSLARTIATRRSKS